MTELGLKVKEFRVARRMTQQMLAEKAGVGHALVVALEAGRRRYVSVEDVERLATALGLPSAELWETIPGGKQDKRYISIFATTEGRMERPA